MTGDADQRQRGGDQPVEAGVEQLVDRVHVGGQPRDHPAGGVPLVEGQAQRLEVVEHPAAQVEQDGLADPAGPDAGTLRATACVASATPARPTITSSGSRSLSGEHRRDAAVDALLDQVGDRQPRGVLDQHDRDQDPDHPPVRPQQLAEQRAGLPRRGARARAPRSAPRRRRASCATPRQSARGSAWPSGSCATSRALLAVDGVGRRAARGTPGTVASSSRCVPTAVMVPPSSSATRSASSTVDARWATTMPVVLAQHPAQRLLDQRLGVHVQRRQRVVEHQHPGRPSTARASASRCRWPPDSDRPCSPTRVSRPHGRS